MKRTPFSRREKLSLSGAALAVLLLGSFGWLLTKAKSLGAMPPHAAMPSPNGFDLYVAAAQAMTRPNPPVDASTDNKRRTPQVAAKLYTPARRAAFVLANAKTWNLMQQARAAQTQHPDIRGNLLAKIPYGPLRDLARGKAIEAKHFKDQKRWDLALQSGLKNMEMGHDIEHGASFIGSLVAIAVQSIGAASLDDVPPHLSAAQAKTGARQLEKIIANGAAPAEVLSEEKWIMLSNMRSTFGGNSSRFAGIVISPFTAPIGPMMDKYIAESSEPRGLQSAPPLPGGVFGGLAAPLHPLFKKSGFNYARRETLESSLLLRLALRAYRLETGSYPDTLAQLAPKYLAQVPRDAFGRGEAMRYRKSSDSYLAWSIGSDGRDDGGKSITTRTPVSKRLTVMTYSLGDVVIKP